MIARRHAAADLQIDEAFVDPVAPHHLVENAIECRAAHRATDPQLAQGPLQALVVPIPVDQPAIEDRNDLIDPIGELHAAVFYMDVGRIVRKVTAVDVSDTGHGCSRDRRCQKTGVNSTSTAKTSRRPTSMPAESSQWATLPRSPSPAFTCAT